MNKTELELEKIKDLIQDPNSRDLAFSILTNNGYSKFEAVKMFVDVLFFDEGNDIREKRSTSGLEKFPLEFYCNFFINENHFSILLYGPHCFFSMGGRRHDKRYAIRQEKIKKDLTPIYSFLKQNIHLID